MKGQSLRQIVLVVLFVLVMAFACGRAASTEPAGDTATQASTEPTTVPTTTRPDVHATVKDVVNDVLAAPGENDKEEEAATGMAIFVGGHVRAEEASTALVEVDVDKRVRVAPNTSFVLRQLDPDTMKLDLSQGQTWINVEGLEEGDTVEVETPTAVASVRGTRWSARLTHAGATVFTTQVDTVTVISKAGGTVEVLPGFQTMVETGAQPSTPEPMTPDEQMRWGMASGENLDVVLPVVGHTAAYTYAGIPLSKDWSSDGRYFVHSYYDTRAMERRHTFYDVQVGGIIPSPLPPDATGVFFNPVGEALAYQVPEGDNTSICTMGYSGGLSGSLSPSRSGLPGKASLALPFEADRLQTTCFGGDALYGWPFWSPDGEWLSFYSNRDAAGAGLPRNRGGGLAKEIVGRQDDDSVFHLYRARPDGSDMEQLTSDGNHAIRHEWSPDGKWIAFVRADEYDAPGDVWVMRADGTDARRVFESIYGNGLAHLAWSPDGKWLAAPATAEGLWIVSTGINGAEEDNWLVPGTDDIMCDEYAWSATDSGWPILLHGYHKVHRQRAVWAYLPGVTDEAWLLADSGWGPAWAPTGDRVASAFVDEASGEAFEVSLFSIEPSLWQN